MKKEKNSYTIHDKPVIDYKEDEFNFKENIVDKIYSLVIDESILPINIAITGEWGIGKSSVINMLRQELAKNEKNLIINLEPLIENKHKISEVIELFYLKLSSIVPAGKIKNLITKSIKSLAIILKGKTTISLPGVQFEKNIGEDIKKLIKVWEKEKPKTFSEQTKKLNEEFKKKDYRLYIIIDEIDRLTSDKILNLLLAVRILDQFDNLVCILGIDYQQTINKIINEKSTGLIDYETTKSYLDKLFQANFPVKINSFKKIAFAIKRIKRIDQDNIFQEFFPSREYETRVQLQKIIDYLYTPRQIKKWLISIKINYEIIKHSPNKLSFLEFLAVITKYPTLFENFSKHTFPIFIKNNFSYIQYLEENYGIDFRTVEKSRIILASIGIINQAIEKEDKLKELLKKVTVHPVGDHKIETFIVDFIESIPHYIINLFCEGYSSELKVSAYINFFDGDVDQTLGILQETSREADLLALDLAETLRKNQIGLKSVPKFDLLNNIWRIKCGDGFDLGNPYPSIILFCLTTFNENDFNQIVEEADLSLSENYIHELLRRHGINNLHGKYDLNDYNPNCNNQGYLKFLQRISLSKEKITNLLREWVTKIQTNLKNASSNWYKQTRLISVFYRYIQFSNALQIDNNRRTLASLLFDFIKNEKIENVDKKNVLEAIKEEYEKFASPDFKNSYKANPFETLFDEDKNFMSAYQEFQLRKITR